MTEVRRATPDDYRILFEEHSLGPIVFNDLSKRFLKEPKLDGTQEGMVLTTIYAAQRRMLDFILQMAAQETVTNAQAIARDVAAEVSYEAQQLPGTES